MTDDGAKDDLETWRANLDAGFVCLFDNNFIPDRQSVPADFNEASFTGYARVQPAGFAAPFINGDGKAEIDSAAVDFTFTGGSGSAFIFGWYLLNAAETEVLMFCKFLVPVDLTPAMPLLSRVLKVTAVSELG